MTKDILVQYCDLREEARDLHSRVQKLERQIEKIEEEGCVTDSVKGGEGGIQHFAITGFPYPEYSRKKTILYARKANLIELEYRLLEMTNKAEEYINNLVDSRTRRILRHRFIDDMTWIQVGIQMGGRATDESVRKECERFLASQ